MKKYYLLAAIFICCLSGSLFAYDRSWYEDDFDDFPYSDRPFLLGRHDFHLELTLDRPELEGSLDVNDGKHPTAVDLDNLKDIEEDWFPGGRLRWDINTRDRLELSYAKFHHDGLTRIPAMFKNKNFKAGSHLDLKNRLFDLSFKRRIQSKFDNLRFVGGVKVFNTVITADGLLSGFTDRIAHANYEKVFVLPYGGLNIGFKLSRKAIVNLCLLYGNFPAGGGYDGEHYELGISLDICLNRDRSGNETILKIGYGKTKYEIDGNGNNIEYKYAGPKVALDFSF